MELAVFAVFALLTLAGALATVIWRSPIRAALSLIVCLFGLAGLYVTLYAHFLAAMQVLVYAGAIMVLFAFAIMMLGAGPLDEKRSRVPWLQILSGTVVALLLGKVVKALLNAAPSHGTAQAVLDGDSFGSVGAVADVMLKQFLMPFELISVLLLVAVVVAVVVAKNRFFREVEK